MKAVMSGVTIMSQTPINQMDVYFGELEGWGWGGNAQNVWASNTLVVIK